MNGRRMWGPRGNEAINDRIGIARTRISNRRAISSQANVKKADFDALNAAAEKDSPDSGQARATRCCAQAFTKTLDESNSRLQRFDDGDSVSYNASIATSQRQRGKVRDIFEAR